MSGTKTMEQHGVKQEDKHKECNTEVRKGSDYRPLIDSLIEQERGCW